MLSGQTPDSSLHTPQTLQEQSPDSDRQPGFNTLKSGGEGNPAYQRINTLYTPKFNYSEKS
jgi:hypothetical protein